MKKHDILSILITFVVGIIAGIYLYLTGLPIIISDTDIPDIDETAGVSIEGEFYGGCATKCPFFQVLGDGSYRFIYIPEVTTQERVFEGTLPFGIKQDLNEAITEKTLISQSQLTDKKNCASYTEGSDLKYVITIDGVEYDIDSCYTAVDGQGKLWLALSEMVNYMSTNN